MVYTSLLVNDTKDVIASTGNTVFFEHTVNDATKGLNPVKEGYTLIGILIPYEPLPKGTASTASSRARCIFKAGTILLGARWKVGKDTCIKFLTGMSGGSYAATVNDVNLCAVPYSCKRLRICMMDQELKVKVFGSEFVELTSKLVGQWPLLTPYKEQNFFGPKVDVLKQLQNFDDLARANNHNVEITAAITQYSVKVISDKAYDVFKQLGSTSGVSIAVRKDAQNKFVSQVQLHIEMAVKAFSSISRDGLAWLNSELGDVMAKHSIDTRLSTATGPSWQARQLAQAAAAQGVAAPAASVPQRPSRKTSTSVEVSPPQRQRRQSQRSR